MPTTESESDTATACRRRPGGRSARVRAAVFRATEELAGECGSEKLTVPAVAARAGVNPTTVYRRWGTVSALLADLAAVRIEHAELPDTGSVAGDLEAFAEAVLEELAQPGAIAFLRVEVDADLRARRAGLERCLALRDAQITEVLRRAEARGDPLRGLTAERIHDRLVAPVYYRVLFGFPGTDAAFARALARELTG